MLCVPKESRLLEVSSFLIIFKFIFTFLSVLERKARGAYAKSAHNCRHTFVSIITTRVHANQIFEHTNGHLNSNKLHTHKYLICTDVVMACVNIGA